MAKSEKQKLKLLYLLKMLEEYSDEEHPLTTAEIIQRLEKQGISCERKTVYSDVACLVDFGYDIIQVSNRRGGGYYLASRNFELPELKLLVDVVQSSRFITAKKSRDLIRKLEKLAGRVDAGKLQRQVYVAGRIKTENESIYYNIDQIHNAIQNNRQLRFDYMEWNLKKKLVPRGERRTVSPWALIWKDENYYLAAYDGCSGILKHYRVDKMGSVEMLSEARQGLEQFEQLDLAAYTNKTFGMYGGEDEVVVLEFPKELIGVVLDRFGKDVDLRPVQEERFSVRVRVAVSGQFFGWLAGIGPQARILSPDKTKDAYQRWLMDILKTEKEG